MAQRRPKPLPTWEAIASFYAGRPVHVRYDPGLKTGATTGLAESGEIILGPTVWDSLNAWRKAWQGGTPAWKRSGAAAGANGLASLIHEAMHNRAFNTAAGFNPAASESQAIVLGGELLPDLLARYFGARRNSPLTNLYLRAARARGEYQGAQAQAGDRYAWLLQQARNPTWLTTP